MKSDSELMNELAHKTNYLHEMTSSESSAMKRALLDIYRDVAKLCEKEVHILRGICKAVLSKTPKLNT